MKRCPACQRDYQEEMSFCLEDGAKLVSLSASAPDQNATLLIPPARLTNQAPTEAFAASEAPPTHPSPPLAQQRHPSVSEQTPPPRNSKALPWVLGAVILGLAGIIVGMMLMRGQDDSQTAKDSGQSENTTPAPEASPTMSEGENPVVEPSRGDAPRETPTGELTERPSPTPRPSPSPRSTPERVVADKPTPAPQPTPATRPRAPISGGVLNGKAISKPQPAYPAIARAARASGTVTVQVTIDESGKVVSARAVGGHPLLQQSAVQAAYGARFSPTLLSGQPVKVTGVILYNFVAP